MCVWRSKVARRVLILGTTGIGKRTIAERVGEIGRDDNCRVEIIDFEHRYLERVLGVNGLRDFLMSDMYHQAVTWQTAWSRLVRDRPELSSRSKVASQDTIFVLVIHGTIAESSYGVRPSLNIEHLCSDFQPDIVITLISDVYDMWWTTEARASTWGIFPHPHIGAIIDSTSM